MPHWKFEHAIEAWGWQRKIDLQIEGRAIRRRFGISSALRSG
jgi:hypothetical protein